MTMMTMCVHAQYMCVHFVIVLWRSEGSIRCLPLSYSMIPFETGSFHYTQSLPTD